MRWWRPVACLETSQDPARSEQYLLNIKVNLEKQEHFFVCLFALLFTVHLCYPSKKVNTILLGE